MIDKTRRDLRKYAEPINVNAMGATPPLVPGERLVGVQKPDGSIFQAASSGKSWDLGDRKIPSIAKPIEGGWSHGMLTGGEKIIPDSTSSSSGTTQSINAGPLQTQSVIPQEVKDLMSKMRAAPNPNITPALKQLPRLASQGLAGAGTGALGNMMVDQIMPAPAKGSDYLSDVANQFRNTAVNIGGGALGGAAVGGGVGAVPGAIGGGVYDLTNKGFTGVKDLYDTAANLTTGWKGLSSKPLPKPAKSNYQIKPPAPTSGIRG